MSRSPKRLLVTGGAGFIGSNFIRHLFLKTDFNGAVLNFDALTYAGNPRSLADIEKELPKRYQLFHADILDKGALEKSFAAFDPDMVVHFAAESHVDRSIHGPEAFVRTNVLGTFQLLEEARKQFKKHPDFLFHHVSTDEVYGSLGAEGFFYETTAYSPNSPYSASKAGSDHLVRSYHHTYGLPVTVSNCSNNYGPYQFPEKLIPVMIENILEGKPLPVYGDGKNVRDWLHVEDHAAAIWKILQESPAGETWNIGGENEWTNLKLVESLCAKMETLLQKPAAHFKKLISFVKDRPGHDLRYAINCDKIKSRLGFKLSYDFDRGLDHTIEWYLANREWIAEVKSGAYRDWMKKHYA